MPYKRLRDYGVKIGDLPTGLLNKITDVDGVSVGHATITNDSIQTGVTAILPHQGNIYANKVIGASYVVNGFGKTIGTIQVDELGTIETPILLTNTLSIGACTDALLKYMVNHNKQIGRTTGTVNPIVAECNDMYLNDIRSFAVNEGHVLSAISSATVDFTEGNVGAGTGMKCFGLKGGIGSSSRVITYEHGEYTIGVLTLTNFGILEHLHIDGKKAGKVINKLLPTQSEADKGSIIVVIATDLPLTSRQLKRVTKRATVGLSRTGSFLGNGSGDIFLGFTTANQVSHESNSLQTVSHIHENDIDQAFIAVADSTEEAILNSMLMSQTTIGRDGNTLYSLNEYMDQIFHN